MAHQVAAVSTGGGSDGPAMAQATGTGDTGGPAPTTLTPASRETGLKVTKIGLGYVQVLVNGKLATVTGFKDMGMAALPTWTSLTGYDVGKSASAPTETVQLPVTAKITETRALIGSAPPTDAFVYNVVQSQVAAIADTPSAQASTATQTGMEWLSTPIQTELTGVRFLHAVAALDVSAHAKTWSGQVNAIEAPIQIPIQADADDTGAARAADATHQFTLNFVGTGMMPFTGGEVAIS
ncbi:MAG: hypothetical protein FJY98_04730 [Candidatus Liptonbacteria bacterium]|nr:hypothetical protein [Candidatus Liptonbacteria bacterium]